MEHANNVKMNKFRQKQQKTYELPIERNYLLLELDLIKNLSQYTTLF
jgi:hypothetical protein